jgi:hypothetical protein
MTPVGGNCYFIWRFRHFPWYVALPYKRPLAVSYWFTDKQLKYCTCYLYTIYNNSPTFVELSIMLGKHVFNFNNSLVVVIKIETIADCSIAFICCIVYWSESPSTLPFVVWSVLQVSVCSLNCPLSIVTFGFISCLLRTKCNIHRYNWILKNKPWPLWAEVHCSQVQYFSCLSVNQYETASGRL